MPIHPLTPNCCSLKRRSKLSGSKVKDIERANVQKDRDGQYYISTIGSNLAKVSDFAGVVEVAPTQTTSWRFTITSASKRLDRPLSMR